MRIKELTLYTPQPDKLKEFYAGVLDLPVLQYDPDAVSFKIGNSILNFVKRPKTTIYHYAITIPANKTEEALLWLKQRTDILLCNGFETQDFPAWNAEAIYFHDPDKNIGELIARKNLQNPESTEFGQNQFLELSEIGIPTQNIQQIYQQLNAHCGLDIYDGSFERFCAVGEDSGLFICVDQNKKRWFPTDQPAHPADFSVRFEHKNSEYRVQYQNATLNCTAL